jgi:hypothetical protein
MPGRVEPAEAVDRYRRWLASVPLAERSKREYGRNAEAFCGWLARSTTRRPPAAGSAPRPGGARPAPAHSLRPPTPNPHLKPRAARAHRALPSAGHELHHQLERSLPDRDHRPARTRTPSGQRDRSGTHLRGALRARQPARPLQVQPPRARRRRLRRLRPANINRLHGGEVVSTTQNRAARDGD